MAAEKRERVIVMRLQKGWCFDRSRRRFAKEGSAPVSVKEDLPKYTRIAQQVPALATKRKRTKAEDELARSFHICLPQNAKPGPILRRVRAWACVEEAWLNPAVSPARA